MEVVLSIIVNVLSAGHGAYFLDTKNDFSAVTLKKKLDKTEENQVAFIPTLYSDTAFLLQLKISGKNPKHVK